MAIDKGNIKTSVNYKVTAQKPLDARTKRPTKADLFKKESWEYDEDTVYIYNGMLVYVEDEKKTYCLTDVANFDKESGWELVGTGAGGGSGVPTLVIKSDKDFAFAEGLNTNGGVINDPNITYAKVKSAVDNGQLIALAEPSGNITYCTKADYVVPNENGERRIMLFFTWRYGDVDYGATIYVGLNNSLTYIGWRIDLSSIGEGISEEKEVYIGTNPTEEAKIWIDPTGTTGRNLETRILYVPELTAGDVLTDEEKAYNVETCQKLIDGTATAYVSNGVLTVYADHIRDLSELEFNGYAITFMGYGSVVINEGDVELTLPDVSTSITIPEDVTEYNYLSLVIAVALSESFPVFYFKKNAVLHLFTEVGIESGVILLSVEYYDYTTKVVHICLLSQDENATLIRRYPTKIHLHNPSDTEKTYNKEWMATRDLTRCETPTLILRGIYYQPIYIIKNAVNTGYADFVIYEDGAFETWRVYDDGSTEKITNTSA